MTGSAIGLVASALARGIAPDPTTKPSAFARENLVIPDGPRAGQLWDPKLTPQLVEILDCLGQEHPCTRVSVRKSAQVGFTQVGIAWAGSVIANTPAKMLIVMPTIDAGDEFNSEKLNPTIEETPALRRRVSAAKSRSSRASTARKKKFPGGSITITGANSTVDLRSKTVKYVIADEINDWPADLNGQGDPMAMVNARFRAFLAVGGYKKLEGSTPTIKGTEKNPSRIDAAFEAGDQRYWEVECPHCGGEQRLLFKHLKFEKTYPHRAHYECQCCGFPIEHHHKTAMVQGGRWIAAAPGPGRHPSFHLDTLSSLLVTWDDIAAAWVDAQGDPTKLKAFVNLWLGESWEERGEAPEWERLHARRETYAKGTIPPGGMIITASADVQGNGLFYEVKSWGVGKECWSIDIGFLPGDTADIDSPAWIALGEVYERTYPDAYGNAWGIDVFGVDSGFNTSVVYQWVRRRPKAMALKGEDGWYRPAIGTPSRQDINWQGKKLRRGVVLWPVGTWPMKSELYGNLRKLGVKEGADCNPAGYCHFAEFHDEAYFRQLTSEYLVERQVRGKTLRVWDHNGPNHYHDCDIYNRALADHLGVARMTVDDWARLAAIRNVPPPKPQGDLFAVAAMPAPPPQPLPASAAPAPQERATRSGYLSGRSAQRGGWLSGRR